MDLFDMPAALIEERKPIAGREFEGRILHRAAHAPAAPERHGRRGQIIHDPEARAAHGAQVAGERCGFVVGEIRNHAFGQHENSLRARIDPVQQLLPLGHIGEIDSHTLHPAGSRVIAEDPLLVIHHVRIVGLDPTEFRRQRHAIGPCIEAGAEAQHRIDPRANGGHDVIVDDAGAQCHGPSDDG